MSPLISGGLFINGQWQIGLGTQFDSVNPANNQVIWQGRSADQTQVDEAILSARTAFKAWSRLALSERIHIVEKFAELLKTNTEQMAQTIALIS